MHVRASARTRLWVCNVHECRTHVSRALSCAAPHPIPPHPTPPHRLAVRRGRGTRGTDADKRAYGEYYELLLQLVRPGGLIAVDNVLFYGRVADPQVGG